MTAAEHIAKAEQLLGMDASWASAWPTTANMYAARALAHIAMATYLDNKANPRV